MPVLQEPAPLSKAKKRICQIHPIHKGRRGPRTRTDRSRSTHSNPRLNEMTQVPLQHHNRWEEAHSRPLHNKGSNNTSTHHPPPGGYTYPPPQQHIPQNNQIIIQQDPDTAAALQQMAQLHQQHFKTSQNQTRALKNNTSSMSFTSTVGCIPIYDGRDKDTCTKWLQRCKEASFYTGYSFRSALLQRSSQDVANVIRSLDEDFSHDHLIEEIMCAFSGIPSTTAAIDELSCIWQQPGQNFLIYISKYRDLHWWCMKKLPQEETYKLTLSQFCSSLQDPIGRKLCKKLWDDKKSCKLANLQKCFDRVTQAYNWYRLTEHRRDLEILESTVEINETSYQQKSNHGGQHQNNYNANRGNTQGFKNNNFNGKKVRALLDTSA